MRTLIAAPLSIGLALKNERSNRTAKPVRRTVGTSKEPDDRRSRPNLRPPTTSAPGPARDHRARQGVDAALLELQDLFFASCIHYPSDEQLQQRMRTHCREIEATLRPGELRDWRSGRDCLLARLGFRLALE